jgi:predicted XRE-type DNA-binding protein
LGKQRANGSLLGIKQPEVSHLMNGHFRRFTTDKLLEFLKRLDQTVSIRIRPNRPGEPHQDVGFGT